ncbi:GNAT family N-acetyltransferase, partial [Promicromonospora sp. NPDC023987]|uniref:GNAT family N-acetyltransferase n=1 Tax=Promicromonospora sp. NPDC023987 TaxID=3155360 RepID=UPI0034056362
MTSEPRAASTAPTQTSTTQAAPPSVVQHGSPPVPAAPPGVVRRATAEDAAEVAWLAALTFPLACPPEASAVEMATHIAQRLTPAHFREWAASEAHALLVHDGGTALLGYALLVLGAPEGAAEADAVRQASGREGPYVELSKIYVQPGAQGRGVAGELMRAASDAAAELGPGLPYWLGTNAQNLRARAFYRKHGFDVIGRRTFVVGGLAHDDVVLLRTSQRLAGARVEVAGADAGFLVTVGAAWFATLLTLAA